MRILIHTCCALCVSKTLPALQAEFPQNQYELFWYNPNIHPIIEYRRRLKSVKMLAERISIPLQIEDRYELKHFCKSIHPNYDSPMRCEICYRMRLTLCATAAKKSKYDAFTTSLLSSTEQQHDLIIAIGNNVGEKIGTPFLYVDARSTVPAENWLTNLYKQSYCGCVFSEQDRYENTSLHIYQPKNK